MKKFIVPMMLSVLAVGGLTSCNNIETQTVQANPIHVRRANDSVSSLEQHKVSSYVNGEVKNIVNATNSELEIPTKLFVPNKLEDFGGKTEFEYMGFKYLVTETDGSIEVKRNTIADDYKTVTEVYFGPIEGGDSFFGMYSACNSFTSVKTIYGADAFSLSMKGLTTLETIVSNSETSFAFEEVVPETFKNVVFTNTIHTISGLENCHDGVKFIAPASVAMDVRNALDLAYASLDDDSATRPILYVIPDDMSPMEVNSEYPTYEFGGLYFSRSQNSTSYECSNVGQYVTKGVFDTRTLEEEGINIKFTDFSGHYHIDELYYIQPTSTTYNLLAYLDIGEVHLDRAVSSYAIRYFETCDEVYFPATDTVVSTVNCNAVPENTTFYIPEGHDTQYAKLLNNSYLSGKVEYYDPSTYTPEIEVNYKGEVVSTKDLSTSARSLLEKAMNPEEDEEDKLTPEEQEKLEEDKEAAAPVTDYITSLGEITLDSKDAILEAKEAFEELSYDQQQLVENIEELEDAIKAYNELVEEYNEDIEDEEDKLELIEKLHIKNKVEGFIEDIKDNKAMTAVTVVGGTILGGALLYGIYKLISKFFKWLKR